MFETVLKEINFKKYKQKKNQFYSVHVVLRQKVWAVKLFQEESSFWVIHFNILEFLQFLQFIFRASTTCGVTLTRTKRMRAPRQPKTRATTKNWWRVKRSLGPGLVRSLIQDRDRKARTRRDGSLARGLAFAFLLFYANWFANYNYSQTCANGHLWTTATCQQRLAQVPCPTNPTMTLPRILDQTLNSGRPLNNGHFLGVPRVAVVHRFDCILNFKKSSVK
jgi:hypothetical protein